MAVLFGFTGHPSPHLLRHFDQTLSHRGSFHPADCVTPYGTLGTRAMWRDLPTSGGTIHGIVSRHNVSLAISGQLSSPQDVSLDRLLDQYQREGINFVQTLQGAFILTILDHDQLYLVRDGAGRRTAYYTLHQGRFCFAIEPKALYRMPGFSPQLRPGAIAQYLTFSFLPGKHTMLEGLYEVPAGTVINYEASRTTCHSHRYTRLEASTPSPDEQHFSDAQWINRFQQDFTAATHDMRPRDEPLAIFLSGGIDSSVVTAEVQAQHHTKPLKTFSIHFGAHYPHELDYARQVATHCGTEHEELLIQPRQFLPHLHDMIWHLDEPIGDPVALPNYELARTVAQQGFRWVFNGEGGDPCFGGPKNLPMLLQHWYGGVDKTPNFREKLYLASYRRAYEELDYLLTPDWRDQIDPEHDLEAILSPFFQAASPPRFLDKLLAINMRLKGAHLILPKVERMLAASGLVPLSPLFDERMMQLAFLLPGHLKLRGHVEKVILKEAFKHRLPQAIIDRPKSGMRVPVHDWFQGELKRYAHKILSPRQVKSTGIFRPERVQQLLKYKTTEGPGRYGLRLWMLLTFELWRRMVFGEATG